MVVTCVWCLEEHAPPNLSTFQLCNVILLTVLTTLWIKSPKIIHFLSLKLCALELTLFIFCSPPILWLQSFGSLIQWFWFWFVFLCIISLNLMSSIFNCVATNGKTLSCISHNSFFIWRKQTCHFKWITRMTSCQLEDFFLHLYVAGSYIGKWILVFPRVITLVHSE